MTKQSLEETDQQGKLMIENPISDIRSKLNSFQEGLGGIASRFQIPHEIADTVLALDWNAFEELTGGFIDKSIWEKIQMTYHQNGPDALSGLTLGSTKIIVGTDYAIWDGNTWINESNVSQIISGRQQG